MTSTRDSLAGLVIDPVLQEAWQECAPGAELVGIAGATASTQGSVVVVSATPVDDAVLTAANRRLAEVLGVRAVEVVVVAGGSTLADLVRDWTYQAGQGSGRGVHVKVRAGEDRDDGGDRDRSDGNGDGDGDDVDRDGDRDDVIRDGPVRVLVRAIDSSARELAFRLASQQEPALPALRALLGGREITVEDEESSPE